MNLSGWTQRCVARSTKTSFCSLPLVIAAACGGAAAHGVVVDTLAAGSIVVTNPSPGRWRTGEVWQASQVLRLGGVGAGSGVEFVDIRAFARDSRDWIWVLDAGTRSVQVFDTAGVFVRRIGREGGGPGEFLNPIGMAWDGDDMLWIADAANSRYTVFDTAGNLVATHPRSVLGWRLPWPGQFGADGVLRDVSYPGNPLTGNTATLVHRIAGDAMLPVDTFVVPEFQPAVFRIEFPSGGTTLPIPYSPQLSWHLDSTGAIWWGTGAVFELLRLSPRGDTLMQVRVARPSTAVTEEERRRAAANLAALDEPMRSQVDAKLLPGTKPAYAWFVIDDAGYLWVRRIATPADTVPGFDVIRPDGVLLGHVAVDIGAWPRPVISGNVMIGTGSDAAGLPQVVVYRIQRDGG